MILFDIDGCSIAVTAPEGLEPHLHQIFGNFSQIEECSTAEILEVIPCEDERYRLQWRGSVLSENISEDELPGILCEQIETILAAIAPDTALRAGAVRHDGSSVVIIGPAGCGKSAMTAWLTDHGFEYLADHFVSLASTHASAHGAPDVISPLPMPMRLSDRKRKSAQIGPEGVVHHSDGVDFLAVSAENRAINRIERCKLILYPVFRPSTALEFVPLNSTEAKLLLMQALHPIQGAASKHSARTKAFSEAVPAVAVYFSDYNSFSGQLDRLVHEFLSREPDRYLAETVCSYWHRSGMVRSVLDKPVRKVPRRAWPVGRKPKLTIGMATYDDFDGVYFTIQSLRMHHSEIDDDVEYIVIDNHPDGACGKALREMEATISNLRYIPYGDFVSPIVKEQVMKFSESEYILILDCHVLLAPGSVARLIDYFEQNPDTSDLLQGPMIWDQLDEVATHLAPRWRGGFFGIPEEDRRGVNPESPPFPIEMQGLGLYACRRDAWPGFSPRFRGWGGEEGYIHEKFRQRGRRTLCLPFLRWLHRFQRPFGIPYKFNWDDRIHNYLVGAYELGYSPDDAIRHFREIIPDQADRIIASVFAEIEEYRRHDQQTLKAARA